MVDFCGEHHIDDPFTWMNLVEPRVIDLWIAAKIVENEQPRPGMVTAEQFLQRMSAECQAISE